MWSHAQTYLRSAQRWWMGDIKVRPPTGGVSDRVAVAGRLPEAQGRGGEGGGACWVHRAAARVLL